MDISEIIRKLTGGMDPNDAVMNAQGAMPPSGPPPQQAGPPPGTAPQGIQTPVTNPAPANQAPKTLQSPPDLANMYAMMMQRSQNAEKLDGSLQNQYIAEMRRQQNMSGLDSGLTLIAAGLSNSPTNRAALIQSTGGGGGGRGMSLSAGDLINFEKQRAETQNALIRKQALPSLMKQYGWTPAQAAALEAGGKLDEVLKHHMTSTLGSAVDKGTGQTILYNQNNGKEVTRLGSEEPETGEFVQGPNGPVLKSKRIEPGTLAEPVGLAPTEMKRQFDEFNAVLEAQGKPTMTPAEFFKMKSPGTSVSVNTGPNGEKYQDPPKGEDYVRETEGPRAGMPKLTADGKLQTYPLVGGKSDTEAKITAREEADKAKSERVAKATVNFASSNAGKAINDAFEDVDRPGAVGPFAKLVRQIDFLGLSPAADMDAAVNTINANLSITQLNALRKASATGASGLGAATEAEHRMLQSTIDDLRVYASRKRFKEGLARVKAGFILLAGDDFEKGTDQAGFDRKLDEMSKQFLVDESNKKTGNKVTIKKVTP